MKEKGLVPKRRFKEFENGPNWNCKMLGELSELSSSKRIHRSEYVERGVPFFRGLEITKLGNSSFMDDLQYISKKQYERLRSVYGVPEKGDILITAVGTLGNTHLILDDNPFYFKDGNLIWIRKININSLFLNFYLNEGKGNNRVLDSAVGSNQKALTMIKLDETPVMYPSDEEQKQIGVFFQTLNDLININEYKLSKLETLKQSYIHEMFPQKGSDVPEMRFDGFENPWTKTTLGEIADIVGGGTPSTSNYDYWGGPIDWYSPTEIGDSIYANRSQRTITELGLRKSSAKVLPADRTILFTSRAGIGDMAILRHPAATNQGFQSIVLNEDNDAYFIYSMGHIVKEYALRNASGSTFLEISGKLLANAELLLPAFEEQKLIGNFFKKLDNQIDAQQRKLEKLREMKKAYLEEMFV